MTRNAFGARWEVLLAAFLACAAAAAWAAPKKHPSLVDPAKAKCQTCHGEMTAKKVVHPPAGDDCRTCHDVKKAEGGMTVELTASGPDLCLTCHDPLTKAAKGELKSSHAPVTDSCTNCHDPHSTAEPKLLKSPAKDLCLSCHTVEDLAKAHPVSVGKANCLSCHSPHGSDSPKLIKGKVVHPPFAEKSCETCHQKGRSVRSRGKRGQGQATVCFACHSDLEAKFAKGFVHSVVKQGRCTGCHDPHAADEKKLLKAKGPALCFPCHDDIRAKTSLASAHAPAKDDCTSCHDPHRSDHARQLSDGVPGLCAGCHDPSDKALVKKHLGADLAKLACLSCHDPHGSKAKKLVIGVSVHPPFAEGSCDACHQQGSAKKLAENGGKALCTACHSDVEEAAKKAKVQHPPLDDACTACHTPHAAPRAKLIRLPGGEVCTACHDDQAAKKEKGEVAHGVIDLIGCRACHEPHGGDAPKLLREKGSALCLGCHDPKNLKPDGKGVVKLLERFEVPAKVAAGITTIQLSADGLRNHPVTGHRTLGTPTEKELKESRAQTSFLGELTCLTCHDPHKGRSPSLFVGGASSGAEVCLRCHAK